jgi:hypothetical protein
MRSLFYETESYSLMSSFFLNPGYLKPGKKKKISSENPTESHEDEAEITIDYSNVFKFLQKDTKQLDSAVEFAVQELSILIYKNEIIDILCYKPFIFQTICEMYLCEHQREIMSLGDENLKQFSKPEIIKIPRHYSKFYKREIEKNFTFVASDGLIFVVHSLVIIVMSPVFEAFLGSSINTKEQQERKMYLAYNKEVIEQFVRFCYCGDLLVTRATVFELIKIADFFDVRGMMDVCLSRLADYLDITMALKGWMEFDCKSGTAGAKVCFPHRLALFRVYGGIFPGSF